MKTYWKIKFEGDSVVLGKELSELIPSMSSMKIEDSWSYVFRVVIVSDVFDVRQFRKEFVERKRENPRIGWEVEREAFLYWTEATREEWEKLYEFEAKRVLKKKLEGE